MKNMLIAVGAISLVVAGVVLYLQNTGAEALLEPRSDDEAPSNSDGLGSVREISTHAMG